MSPKLGDTFIGDQHGSVVGESAKVIVYLSDNVDPKIYYDLKIDGQRVGRAFHGAFFSTVVEPGIRDVTAVEYWTGEGLGKSFGEAVNPAKLFFESPDLGLPESLNAGTKTLQSLDVAPGEMIFLRLMKREGKEFFYTCEETRDTTTMCRGVYFESAIERVAEATAREQLIGQQQSL